MTFMYIQMGFEVAYNERLKRRQIEPRILDKYPKWN